MLLEEVSHFGHYEPLTGVVTFWENSVSLADIIVEAQLVLWTIEDQRPWPAAFLP